MFEKIEIENINLKPFKLIGKDWMLLTSGMANNLNMMTASWGGLGVLWNKKIATVYVRPQRYTKEFIDKFEYFTISFFEEKFRSVLNFCGTNSGRDVNKLEKTNLTPKVFENSVAFNEAKLVLVLKKLFVSQMKKEDFIEKNLIDNIYINSDYHYIYIGEITSTFIKN